jgi:hypothetical protein
MPEVTRTRIVAALSAQPAEANVETHPVTSRKRKRDDEASFTGPRKKRALEAASTRVVAAPLLNADQTGASESERPSVRAEQVAKQVADQVAEKEAEQVAEKDADQVANQVADQVADQDAILRASPVPDVEVREPEAHFNPTEAHLNPIQEYPAINQGQNFRAALFAVVATSRLLRQRRKLRDDCHERWVRLRRVAHNAEMALEDLERVRDQQPVDQEFLDELAKYQGHVRSFVPARDSKREEFHRLSSGNDALERQVEHGVVSLFAYGEDLKHEESLQFLANDQSFWEIFETRQMANTAAETVKHQLKAIAEEQRAILDHLEGRFKSTLAERLTSADSERPGVYAAANLAEVTNEDPNALDLERLSDLEIQRDHLTYEDNFTYVDGNSQSEQLLKLAECGFTEAGLLEVDNNAGEDQEEQRQMAAHVVLGGGEGNESVVSQQLAASRIELPKAVEYGEAQANDPMNKSDLVTQPTLEELVNSRLAAAANMTTRDIEAEFKRVREDFRAKRQNFESEHYRRLSEEELANLPQPISEDDKGEALFRKLVSHTSAYRLAEKEFHAWREVAVKRDIEPESREDKPVEIAPDRSDDGYPQTTFICKKEQVGPKVQRWLRDARENKSPSLTSVKKPDSKYDIAEMGSLAFDEDVQDQAFKNTYSDRINQLQQMRDEIRKAGNFENPENDFHPRNRPAFQEHPL